MKKIFTICTICILAVSFLCAGCKKEASSNSSDYVTADSSISNGMVYKQKQLTEPEELTVSEAGTLEVEAETLAKPDGTAAEEKSVFLGVTLKEDADISVQYTYDTYGKEGSILCCDAKDTESTLKPICAMRLAQSSEENYGDIWLSGGIFLTKGENLFYLSGGDQTLPYRMVLKLTFFEPEKVESAILYPAEQ